MIKNYKDSLIEPLLSSELHIFHSDKYIDKLMKDVSAVIRNRVHGCYLLGGFRGVGKTSFVNLCCTRHSKDKLLPINIDCSKFINSNNFIYFFIEELVNKITNEVELENDLKREIEDLNNRIIYKNIRKTTSINSSKDITNDAYELTESRNLALSIPFVDKIISYLNKNESQNKSKTEKNSGIEYFKTVEFEEKNDEFILTDKLSKILKRLTEEYENNIIIIIDEIDKQEDDFLENLFDLYKNLFLNSHIITIFIVDSDKFCKFVFNDEIDNKLKSYFIRAFYLPTFEFDDIKSYLYREFEVSNLGEIIKVNYLTCGVMRKINTYNYLEEYNNDDTLIKGIFFEYLLKQYSARQRKNNYERDISKFIIRDLIEVFFYNNKMSENEILGYLQEKSEKYSVKINGEEILEIIKELSPEYKDILTIEEDENNERIYKVCINDNNEFKITQKYITEKVRYDIKDRYFCNINKDILEIESKPINIVSRDTIGFKHLIRIIETSFSSINNIIIVKKICDTWYENEEYCNYSGILIMDKPIGCIVYYIDECSFSDERPFTVQSLIDLLNENGIKVITIETDNEPIQDNIKFIINKAREIILGE